MKRLFAACAALAVLTVGAAALASAPAAKPKTVTLKGEIVDTGCYLGRGAHGEKHKECAQKCASEGMPLGLLTSKGKVYLLTLNHDNADPFNKAKELAGADVEIAGTVMERGGISAIEVDSVKELAAAAK